MNCSDSGSKQRAELLRLAENALAELRRFPQSVNMTAAGKVPGKEEIESLRRSVEAVIANPEKYLNSDDEDAAATSDYYFYRQGWKPGAYWDSYVKFQNYLLTVGTPYAVHMRRIRLSGPNSLRRYKRKLLTSLQPGRGVVPGMFADALRRSLHILAAGVCLFPLVIVLPPFNFYIDYRQGNVPADLSWFGGYWYRLTHLDEFVTIWHAAAYFAVVFLMVIWIEGPRLWFRYQLRK